MTDTGRFPERGQLDQTGGTPGRTDLPATPAQPVYPYPHAALDAEPEEEELLMPGAHTPWSEPAPAHHHPAGTPAAGTPVAETPYGTDPHLPPPGGPAVPGAVPGMPPQGAAPHGLPSEHLPQGHAAPGYPPHSELSHAAYPAQPAAPQTPPHGAPAPPVMPHQPAEYPQPGSPVAPPGEFSPYAPEASPGHGGLPVQPDAWQHSAEPVPHPATSLPEPDRPLAAEPAAAPETALAPEPAPAPEPVARVSEPAPVAPPAESGSVPADPGHGAEGGTGDAPPAYAPAEAQPIQPPTAEEQPPVPGASGGESAGASGGEAAPAGTEVSGGEPPALDAAQAPAPLPQPDAAEAQASLPAQREESPDAASAPAAPAAGDVPGAAEEPAVHPAPSPEGAAPGGPRPAPAGYDETEREAVHRLMRDRRDAHQGFTADPIAHEVLLRVLEAAHTAPTVGHAQPWDFVIIRSPETRRAVHDLAQRQREAHAKSLPRARAKQVLEAAPEPILTTPVNIVVTADPTRGGRPAHSPDSRPEAAPYSTALAVENLWLAARAEGLGVGWVGFHDERELVRTLDLPEHLDIVAYLCVGYVEQSTDDARAGASAPSAARPLSWVVHDESYGRRALPGAEPHDLLAETLTQIRPLDAQALGEAWERQRRMTKPTGALGALEVISAQLCGLTRSCPPPIPEPAALAVFAGDHGVHAQEVTTWPKEVTAQMVANFLAGGAVCNAFAAQVGAEVCVVDVGVQGDLPPLPGLMPRKVRHGTADFTTGPALTREDVLRAVEIGIETARDLVAAGNRALLTGEMGVGNTTVSAALIAAFTGADPAEVTGRGSGIDDETFHRKIAVVRTAVELHRPDPADPIAVLAALGGLEHAALTGLILGGAALRVPVLLDGVTGGAAALAARAIAPEAVSACIAGHRSAEPGHTVGLTALGLRPLVDLDLRLGEGSGALLALPLVQAAARSLREVATFDAAGITDKN